MRFPVVFAALWLIASPVAAQSLCDVTDPSEIEEIAVGTWAGSMNRALESETISRVVKGQDVSFDIAATKTGLTIDSTFLDSLRGEPFALSEPDEPYDDEQIEEFLTGASDELVDDVLSERTCSAYVLPQLQADLPRTESMSASGTVTLIFYRPDLALRLSNLTLQSPETVIYATETAWLRKGGMTGNEPIGVD